MKKFIAFLLLSSLAISGCSAPGSVVGSPTKNSATEGTQSGDRQAADDLASPESSSQASQEPTNSMAGQSPEQSKSTSNGVVLYRETPGVHGIFWLGMTESEAFDSMKTNNIILDKSHNVDRDEFGAEIVKDISYSPYGVCYSINTTGFLTLDFDKYKKLIFFTAHYPPQDWQKEAQKISSTYSTEKGVKLQDNFDVVGKLYGKPTAIHSADNAAFVYTYKLRDDLYVFFRGTIANGTNEIDLFEYSSSDKMIYDI